MADKGGNDVVKQSDAVSKMAEDWGVIEALMGGTKAMRVAGKKYLPQWPAEDDGSYRARLATATLFAAYSRTISVLSGKPFSKPLTIGEDVPKKFAPWLEDADLQGRNLHAFAADLCSEALGYGFCGILVDYPTTEGVRTVADEKKTGVRPYLVQVLHGSVLGWRTEKINGSLVLTQLRLLENVEVPDGEFATKIVEQVRVLAPGSWRLYQKIKTEGGVETWMVIKEGTTTLNFIPFVPIYGKRKDFMIGCPPMCELAHANVEHWQSKSDQQTILHVARVPMLFAKDIGADTAITVGAGAMINASSPTSDVKYVEHSGKAIEAGRMSLLDLEDRMRQTGAELLVIKPGNTTEVQTLADNEQGMCDLQRIVQQLEDGIDIALQYMGAWIGEKETGHVTIYNDFGAATLAEASAQLLFDMQSVGSLSFKTMLSEMQRRGILSPDIDLDEEITTAKAEAALKGPVVVQETVKP